MADRQHLKFAALLFVATFFMGSSFPTGKFLISTELIPPFYLGGVRFIIAGIALLIYCAFREGFSQIIPHTETSISRGFLNLFLIGLLQTASAMGFLNLALGRIDSALASVLFFTNPLWVLIFAHFIKIDRFTLQRLLGLILGIAGVFLCLNVEKEGSFLGMLFALLGAISWALCTISTKTILAIKNPPFVLAGWQMLFGGIVLYLISSLLGESYSLSEISTLGWFNFLWLIFPASVGSFSLWFLALQKGGAAQTSAFLFLTPMFATILAILFLAETLSVRFILGCLLIFSAIYIINQRKKPSITLRGMK